MPTRDGDRPAPISTAPPSAEEELDDVMLSEATFGTTAVDSRPSQSSLLVPPRPAAEGPPEIPGYRLLTCLGKGGMGEVHLAERLAEGGVAVRCALKLVHSGRRDDPVVTRQLLTEARIVAQLRHPNIVSVFDVGRTGDTVWLAMEWLDGLDAWQLVRRSRERGTTIPLRHVTYVVKEALQGLHHAHVARDSEGGSLNIVHRDVSPGNILISRHGSVKLADFGVAAARVGAEDSLGLVGKLRYLAPELYRGSKATVQSDVFAMGVTLLGLLTMQPIFADVKAPEDIKARMLAFQPAELFRDDLTLPDGIEAILLKSLSPDPARRYPSALAMLEDVSDFAYEAGLRLLDAHFARYVERVLEPVEHAR